MENNNNWKTLWMKNYRGEGDISELENYVKTLDYGSKKNAKYLPWAVVERLFTMQDGEYSVIKENNSVVEKDMLYLRTEKDEISGEMVEKYVNSYFINIQVKWQGRTYIEKYPIQDSNGKPLAFWTQNDINKSIQRGKVKAIAVVSGIGYRLYENVDLQFEDDEIEKTQNNAKELFKKVEAKKTTPVKVETPIVDAPIKTDIKAETQSFLNDIKKEKEKIVDAKIGVVSEFSEKGANDANDIKKEKEVIVDAKIGVAPEVLEKDAVEEMEEAFGVEEITNVKPEKTRTQVESEIKQYYFSGKNQEIKEAVINALKSENAKSTITLKDETIAELYLTVLEIAERNNIKL